MKVLGIDFETQDENAETTRVTEVGAVLIEFDPNPETPLVEVVYKFLHKYDQLCYEPDYPSQTDAIVQLTGITDADLKKYGRPRLEVFKNVIALIEQADLVVAYNKKFDETVCRATAYQLGYLMPDKPWLCALNEVPYPPRFTCRKLSHLAWEHGVHVDRSKLHRAEYDVEIMLLLLAHYGIPQCMEYAAQPWVYIQAIFPGPKYNGFEQGKAKAKKLRYNWQQVPGDERSFPLQWVKRVKSRDVDSELVQAEKIGLTTRVLS